MQAIRIHKHGGPEVLQIDTMDTPRPGPGEALVKIHAAAMNHMDLWVRQGMPGVKIPLPIILGCEASGVIAECGPGLAGWKVGDAVLINPATGCGFCEMCLIGRDNFCRQYGIYGETEDGCEAEFKTVPARNLLPKPEKLSDAEAAAIPLTFLTAWHMLIDKCGMRPGQTVLVIAASSGVGAAAVQIAKLFGAMVIATAGGEDKLVAAKTLGADHVIDHKKQDIAAEARRITGKRGADIVFEHVGAATWEASLKSLAFGGKLVTCGATTGYDVKVDLRHLFIKHQQIIGSTMGSKGTLFEILRHVAAGRLRPVVDRVFSMAEVQAAHRHLEGRKQFGKVVLQITA